MSEQDEFDAALDECEAEEEDARYWDDDDDWDDWDDEDEDGDDGEDCEDQAEDEGSTPLP